MRSPHRPPGSLDGVHGFRLPALVIVGILGSEPADKPLSLISLSFSTWQLNVEISKKELPEPTPVLLPSRNSSSPSLGFPGNMRGGRERRRQKLEIPTPCLSEAFFGSLKWTSVSSRNSGLRFCHLAGLPCTGKAGDRKRDAKDTLELSLPHTPLGTHRERWPERGR